MGSHGISMIFLLDFHDVSLRFHGLWDVKKEPYTISMQILWYFDGVPAGFLLDSCGISMVFL